MRRILIDDLREIEAEVVCKTAKAAYKELEKGIFDIYYFDHDLGSTKPGTSGYDVLTWALENEKIPAGAIVYLVSNNPVGKQRMRDALLNHGCAVLEWATSQLRGYKK